jgi:hypothetical protein
MLNLQNNTFLTVEQMKKQSPSIFTKKGASRTSEKYTHIPTDKVIEDMAMLGWGVVDTKQVKSRVGKGYQKHLVVFRNDDLIIEGEGGDNVIPQILLTNSHDGKNAFTFTAGLFRMVCENGLVISTKEFENLKIRHMGYDFETLRTTINELVEKLPLTVEAMNVFKNTELNMKQMMDFAKKAIEVRFGDDVKNMKFDYKEILSSTRKEDEGNDLWSVFNRVQEKLIHGDFNYEVGVKTRKARKIKNFQQDIVINSKLFDLAYTFCNN